LSRKKGRNAGDDSRQEPETGGFADELDGLEDIVPMDRGRHADPIRSRPPRHTDAAHSGEQARAGSAFRFPQQDEPLLARRDDTSARVFGRLRSGEIRPDYRIDLHRLDRSTARRILAKGIDTASQSGAECVLVTHGWGRASEGRIAIIKEALPGWLSTAPLADHVQAFAPSIARDGGPGATYLLLRR
jgi:DNA-nicking Smr family endonuclease